MFSTAGVIQEKSSKNQDNVFNTAQLDDVQRHAYFQNRGSYVSSSFAYELPTLALVQAHTLAEREYVVEDSTLQFCYIFDADND